MPRIVGAALWMAGALTGFMAMALSGRELSAELGTFQILFWRSLVGLAVISALLSWQGWGEARTRRPGRQLLRNLVHFAGQFGWFYGLAHIPLAQVFAIEFTVPVWTLLLAALFLGEAITRARGLAVALGFLGIVIILRPGVAAVEVAQAAVLGSALAYALTYVLTKDLAGTETPLAILFYMTLVQLPIGLATGLSGWTWPSPGAWIWIVVVGVGALAAHYCIIRAFRLADAAVVAPMDFVRLPLSALIGYALYAEAIDPLVLAGASVIFVGNWLNLRAEHRRAPV